MLTVNGSLKISIYNPATFFGIHVSSSPISLVYSEITVATGQLQLKKYYQPRKSHRIAVVKVVGTKAPLYGAESSLSVSINSIVQVPLTLQFEIRSRGNVVGKLVRTNHWARVSWPWLSTPLTPSLKSSRRTCVFTPEVDCLLGKHKFPQFQFGDMLESN